MVIFIWELKIYCLTCVDKYYLELILPYFIFEKAELRESEPRDPIANSIRKLTTQIIPNPEFV